MHGVRVPLWQTQSAGPVRTAHMSVLLTVNIVSHNPAWSSSDKVIIFPLYLQVVWAKFIYKGHRVKVKVTGAKKVDNAVSDCWQFLNVRLKDMTTVAWLVIMWLASQVIRLVGDIVSFTASRKGTGGDNKVNAIIINVKINVALSENASRTRYTIKIKLKLRKLVLKKKSFQLSFERREWTGRSHLFWSNKTASLTVHDPLLTQTHFCK